MSESMRRFGIGYALAPKKQQSFIQVSLVNLAKERGVDLIKIDTEKPLVDQGPFDCILHKLPGEEWRKQLEDFSLKNPNVLVIDHPDSIERLHNRISMLQVVSELTSPPAAAAVGGVENQNEETFGVPKQIVIYTNEALLDPVVLLDLKFPVIAKPLVADGSAKSHKMSLVFNRDGLNKLKPPIVLQEFVNHGGVIFKVYVVGDHVTCVKRKSLPDVSEEKLASLEGSLPFSQISNLTGQDRLDENYYEAMHLDQAEMPPLSFITDIARGLRRAMRLHLFNFDVIRDVRVGNRYLVIDINYFPGYAKMPLYETVLTDFFVEIFQKTKEENLKVDANCSKLVGSEKEERKLVSNTCGDENDGDVPVSGLSREEKENTLQV
ncbi:hypothetical protein AQUCO_00500495v1 [Aquilegia coerulea]|uniref:Inositol-tetrakisphosphate 1-kinase n=1 Tax=Aquilegia coerulea TaxID=218851 RepID=A0A2G5ES72_AQUCA|nr:hypothetical protein AQUCO_00500495v1 [Aquilegia coerulea]PIA58592.1 hypothetical protein AQUCO_00500495v1 [Aquilegia coerulea]PIA58593.1 hypothetical protein AQUCO_00500495v1 [Aquilegia coerulea]PIA58594.1 hypothetical protein AQUCO_00500495v1 [Aquilegia coerulea]PIA58595.1 hypothetical protein AQUCO_00500495v1 [Aquilegia coerulea]